MALIEWVKHLMWLPCGCTRSADGLNEKAQKASPTCLRAWRGQLGHLNSLAHDLFPDAFPSELSSPWENLDLSFYIAWFLIVLARFPR